LKSAAGEDASENKKRNEPQQTGSGIGIRPGGERRLKHRAGQQATKANFLASACYAPLMFQARAI
jgi:hypothetical protein